MIPSEWVDQAARRLQGQIDRTPPIDDPDFDAFIKWENRHKTGSFKTHDAHHKVLFRWKGIWKESAAG